MNELQTELKTSKEFSLNMTPHLLEAWICMQIPCLFIFKDEIQQSTLESV